MGSWWLVLFLERYGHTVYKTICPFSREVETCSSVSGKRFKLLPSCGRETGAFLPTDFTSLKHSESTLILRNTVNILGNSDKMKYVC